jgi:hypothetical protein
LLDICDREISTSPGGRARLAVTVVRANTQGQDERARRFRSREH